jgi:N6-adenosine-specific RNA methylase IME4
MTPFDVIYADPPWPQNARRKKGTKFGGGAAGHYPLMDWRDIHRMGEGLRGVAAKNSMLFLWATKPLLGQALHVLDDWGWRYTTTAFVWVKTSPKTFSPCKHPGFYTHTNTELCLLGWRGRPLRPVERAEELILSPRRRHSAKPPEAWFRIEQMYPARARLELFARESRPGWTQTGLDFDGADVNEWLENAMLPTRFSEISTLSKLEGV